MKISPINNQILSKTISQKVTKTIPNTVNPSISNIETDTFSKGKSKIFSNLKKCIVRESGMFVLGAGIMGYMLFLKILRHHHR